LLILKNLMMNLKNKKVLITGATGGIGNCLVEKFNNLGASIVASGTNDDKLLNLKKNIQIFIQ
jgi:3-oxoacyl-[acyl-carrier protein] reductase